MPSKILVCTQCGYTGSSSSAVKGSGGVEILLWFFFLVPGLIYSVWRSSSRHSICPKCGNPNLIPIDSPKAQKIMGENMSEKEIEETVESEKNRVLKEKKRNMQKIVFVVVAFTVLMIASMLAGQQ